jgi:hypothetical protein
LLIIVVKSNQRKAKPVLQQLDFRQGSFLSGGRQTAEGGQDVNQPVTSG